MKRVVLIGLLWIVVGELLFSQDKSSDSQLAMEFYQNNEFEKAASLYEKLYDNTDSKIYFSYYLDCLVKLKNFQKADKIIRKEIKRHPDELNYYVELGGLYEYQNQLDKAKEQYETAIKKTGESQIQVTSLANAFINRKQYDFAERAYLKGRQANPSNLFNLELANLYALTSDYQKMMDEYLDFLERSPERQDIVQMYLQDIVVSDKEGNIRKLMRVNLLKRIQTDDINNVYSELLIWLYIQEKNFAAAFIQVKALDRRNNEVGDRLIRYAEIASSNEFYDQSIEAYQSVIEKGVTNPQYALARSGLLNVYYTKVVEGLITSKEEISQLEKSYQTAIQELGKSQGTIRIIKDLAHLQAFYLNKAEQAKELLENVLQMGGISNDLISECKLEYGDVLMLIGNVWEASLVYAQIEEVNKYNPIGNEAKFRKAKLAYYMGNFEWAQAQLDVLKASTSKLMANDAFELSLMISDNTALDTSVTALIKFAGAELLMMQNQDSLALMVFDTIMTQFPGHTLSDDILYKKAEIMIKRRNFEKSIQYLQQIVEKFSYDILADNAMFKEAEIYEFKLKDKNKAMELYKDLMVKFPGSIYVVEARKRFRSLRGDKPDKTTEQNQFQNVIPR